MELMCRACLALVPQDVHNLFVEKDLALRFVECTSLTVDLSDDLPKSLCGNCHEMLLKFYNFQKMCAESVANFTNFLEEHLDAPNEDADHENEENLKIEEIYLIHGGAPDSKEEEIQLPHIDSTNDYTMTETTEPNSQIDDHQLDPHTNSVRSFSCKICEKRFYKLECLRAHLRTHQGLKPYSCVVCAKSYTRADNMRIHMREVHLEKRRSYRCTFGDCSKVYAAKRSLTKHVLEQHARHKTSSKGAHVCETCGKLFRRRALLTRHTYTHMDESKYRFGCDYCGKRFYAKDYLEDHIKRHIRLKCFVCDICGASKVSKAELKAHRNCHTLTKTWGCMSCDKIFNNLGNLRKHIQTVHECIRNYVCRYCDERFAKMYTLRMHEMRHTNTKPHICTYCSRSFIQKGTLNTHIKRLHLKKVP